VRVTLRSVLWSAGLAVVSLSAGLFAGPVASAGNPVAVIVLKEHGVGTATQAQPYLDKFIAIAAQQNGWDPASKGHYETSRGNADTWIKAETPHYGIFSLAAFLANRKAYNLDPIGSATMATGGGQQYFIVSKTADSLAACKGKQLATDHEDQAFVEKVVAAGAFKMADFTVVPTKRFAQAGTMVLNGGAECALIDDAQLAALKQAPGGVDAKTVWSTSSPLPPMVVAAFPSAPAAEKTAFQASLPKICQGGGQQTCNQVGLQTLTTASAQTYAAVVAAYGP
jgi:hypothetical protein